MFARFLVQYIIGILIVVVGGGGVGAQLLVVQSLSLVFALSAVFSNRRDNKIINYSSSNINNNNNRNASGQDNERIRQISNLAITATESKFCPSTAVETIGRLRVCAGFSDPSLLTML